MKLSSADDTSLNQTTNGPVNAHLIAGIVVKFVTVNQGSSFIYNKLCSHLHAKFQDHQIFGSKELKVFTIYICI